MGQGVGKLVVVGQYEPAGQLVQEDVPPNEYWPLVQSVQDVELAGANFPAGHDCGPAVVVGHAEPAGHGVQPLPAEPVEYVPGGQVPVGVICPIVGQ